MKYGRHYFAFLIITFLLINGCAHAPMQFQLAAGTNQSDYQSAVKLCGGDNNQGHFIFGPLILVAPLVVAMEGINYHQKGEMQNCMEAKGFKCVENCHHPSSIKPTPVDPTLLAKWEETIKADKGKEWVYYAKTPSGTSLYYCPSSVSVIDQRYIYFREQLTLSDDNKENYSYIWRSCKVNCADKIFKLSDFVAIDKAGNAVDPNLTETEWRKVVEASPLGTFAFKLCSEKVQQGKEGDVSKTSTKEDKPVTLNQTVVSSPLPKQESTASTLSKLIVPPPLPQEEEWWISIDGEQKDGPFKTSKIMELLSSGKITSNTYMWKEGTTNWKRISEIEQLKNY